MEKISSRHIPDDIILGNILTRVPVRSLCRWKVVSKPWHNSIQNTDQIRPKTQPFQLITIPGTYRYNTDIPIYSIADDEAATTVVLQKYRPPQGSYFTKLYNSGLICSSVSYSQLNVFNTTTGQTMNVTLPYVEDATVFEYVFDPLSEKYKVLKYYARRLCGRNSGWDLLDDTHSLLSSFQILTLDGDNPTWRSVKQLPRVKKLTNSVTVVDGTLFWYNNSENTKLISFNLAKEEFLIIKLQGTCSYFKYPLFELDGSLFFVEKTSSPREQQGDWLELKVWMLKDIDKNIWVLVANNIALPLDGTKFSTDTTMLKSVKFSARTTKLLIAANDKVDIHLFSCSLLNMQCKRSKIIGQLSRGS